METPYGPLGASVVMETHIQCLFSSKKDVVRGRSIRDSVAKCRLSFLLWPFLERKPSSASISERCRYKSRLSVAPKSVRSLSAETFNEGNCSVTIEYRWRCIQMKRHYAIWQNWRHFTHAIKMQVFCGHSVGFNFPVKLSLDYSFLNS